VFAACAIRHGVTVLHVDRDFTLLARTSSLKERRISI
jgi:predicted nucleic acid-binding protein